MNRIVVTKFATTMPGRIATLFFGFLGHPKRTMQKVITGNGITPQQVTLQYAIVSIFFGVSISLLSRFTVASSVGVTDQIIASLEFWFVLSGFVHIVVRLIQATETTIPAIKAIFYSLIIGHTIWVLLAMLALPFITYTRVTLIYLYLFSWERGKFGLSPL